MALDASTPFVWGNGGRRLTPEEILLQRRDASALGQEAMSTAPVGHWSAGLNRVLQGLMSGYDSYSADQASKQNADESSKILGLLLNSAGGATAPAATAPAVAAPTSAPAAIPAGKNEFVSSIWPAVLDASAKTGVDPRIIGAQAAVESGWGQHAPGNNLFGIKSHGQPGGNVLPTTEVVNGQPVRTSDSFRAYASPADSVAGYADFINTNPRYAALKGAQGLDAQATALGASGYATDPSYGAKVAAIARGLPLQAAAPGTGAPVAAPVEDPAALPQNATPTQGFAIPGQPAAAAPAARPAVNPAILRAITSPYVSDDVKKIGTLLFQSQMDQQAKANDPLRNLQIQEARTKLTPMDAPAKDADGNLVQRDALGKVTVLNPAEKAPTSVSEYKYYRDNFQPTGTAPQPMDYATWSTAKARAAATNITNNVGADESSFQKEAGKVQAQRFNDLISEGQQAHQLISDVNTLTDLGKNIGTGKTAEFKAAVGPYAEALGIKVDGLSDIQAYEGIVNRVAPSLRVKGSGAQSDYELKNFLKSLPALGNTPEGNAISAVTMKGLQENKIRAAEIGSQALNGEISRAEADKQLRNLPDPMAQYREYMKANRGAPTATGGTPASAPQQTAPTVNPAALAEARRRGLIQ